VTEIEIDRQMLVSIDKMRTNDVKGQTIFVQTLVCHYVAT